MSEELKKEIGSILASYNNENEATNREIIEKMNTFISSLLAKQQEEFVKMIPEYAKPIEKVPETTEKDRIYNLLNENLVLGYNQCIADIKSKMLNI
jgi:vacuolar-type H+-ATPase subunit E/Vma4